MSVEENGLVILALIPKPKTKIKEKYSVDHSPKTRIFNLYK